jgi:hypothetical protein
MSAVPILFSNNAFFVYRAPFQSRVILALRTFARSAASTPSGFPATVEEYPTETAAPDSSPEAPVHKDEKSIRR